MDVSIIIVNYNTTKLVETCLQTVFAHTKGVSFEVWVVDSASSDRSIEELRLKYPQVNLVMLKENIGFGRANNAAITQTKGEFIFLLNPDTELCSNAVQTFLNFFREPANQQVAVCGGHLFTHTEKQATSYGNFPSLLQSISSSGLFLLYKKYYREQLDTGVANTSMHVREVDFISGAAMFIRKSVLQVCGNFDPDFFMYFEETELCYRIRKAGYLICILPDVRILHHEGGATGENKFNSFSFYHFQRSKKIYYRKVHGKLYQLIVMPFDLLTILVRSLVGSQSGHLWTKLRLFFGHKLF